MMTGKMAIDGRYFHLSFDDGFRVVLHNAAPVLIDLGIPALVFVPTTLVGAPYETAQAFSVGTLGYSSVMEMMDWNDLRTLRSNGFEIGSHTRSHTRLSHDGLCESFLRGEIAGSKRDIEDRVGAECRYISWPYGRRDDVNDESIRLIQEAGYVACFGAFRGAVYPGQETDPYRIPRHHFEVHWPTKHIEYFARGGMEKRCG
jgi:peptidoglycan/xylan/chitin deacetylase (PgdA/CDA1 family)